MVLCVSMPYRPHSSYVPPYAAPPATTAKKRPSAAWFAVGGALMLVATVLFGVTVFHFVRTISHTDAEFPAVGRQVVTVPAHTERGLFVREGQAVPRCQGSDGSGSPLLFRRPAGTFTYGQWVAVRVFDTGDGTLVFSCPLSSGSRLRVAPMPSSGDFARLGLIGILLPLAMGGLGFVVVVVTAILWFTRRPAVSPPGPPPAWAPGPPGWQQPGPPPGGPPPAT